MHAAHNMQMAMPGANHFGMPPFRPPGMPMGPPAARPPGADLDALLSKQTVQGRARTERYILCFVFRQYSVWLNCASSSCSSWMVVSACVISCFMPSVLFVVLGIALQCISKLHSNPHSSPECNLLHFIVWLVHFWCGVQHFVIPLLGKLLLWYVMKMMTVMV